MIITETNHGEKGLTRATTLGGIRNGSKKLSDPPVQFPVVCDCIVIALFVHY